MLNRRLLPAVAVAALGVLVGGTTPHAASAPPLSTLSPGGFNTIQQDLMINVVFVGYEPGAGPPAAEQAQVMVEPQNYTADYKAKGLSPKFIDTVDYKRRAP